MTEQGSQMAARPAFKSTAARERFFAAYAAVLARWPVEVQSTEVLTVYGNTQVHVVGPADASPVLLLHGGGATSTVWFNNVLTLSQDHRVFAVDRIGDAGKSLNDGRPLRGPADLLAWLDALLDALDLPTTALVGHSYGAWLALTYALHASHRVDKLVLLDPTDCFVGLPLAYRLRAIPLFVRPGIQAVRSFLAWETRSAALDPEWLRLTTLAGEVRTKLVLPRRPSAPRLRSLDNPTLVLLAEHSRAAPVHKAASTAKQLLPNATISILAGQSHHTIPTYNAELLNNAITLHLR